MEGKINVTAAEGTSTLIIRDGEAEPIHERKPLDITGTIDTPARFLRNRVLLIGTIAGYKACHVLVDKSVGQISLSIDENSDFADYVTGKIVISDVITNFGINSGKYYTPEDMANFLKSRKHHFESEAIYVDVFTALRQFRATVNQKIAAIKDDMGNYEQKKEQVVEHNIPKAFKLTVPIFKGMPKVSFEVEFIVSKGLDVTLSSTELMQITDELRDKYITEVIEDIEKVAPDIVILYQ